MAVDLPRVCLGLHMLPWTVHPQQMSGDSMAWLTATVHKTTAKVAMCRTLMKNQPSKVNTLMVIKSTKEAWHNTIVLHIRLCTRPTAHLTVFNLNANISGSLLTATTTKLKRLPPALLQCDAKWGSKKKIWFHGHYPAAGKHR